MKSRVKIIKETYITNHEKKVVTCILQCDMQLYKHPADYCIYSHMWSKIPEVDPSGSFRVSAIATCSSRDMFDEEKGRRIAEARAKRKAFMISSRVYREIKKALLRTTSQICNSIIACEHSKEVEEDHIESLIG